MQKTEHVSIGRWPFVCDKDAYEVIRAYLEDAKQALEGDEDQQEILIDIETSLADHLKTLCGDMVVDAESAKKAVEQMGAVTSQSASSRSSDHQEKSDAGQPYSERLKHMLKKPITKDNQRALLDGVCAGIARTLDVDPIWVRIVFVVLAFLTSGGWILVYLALSFMMLPDTKHKRRTAGEVVDDIKQSKFVSEDTKRYGGVLVSFVRGVWKIVRFASLIVIALILLALAVAWSLVCFTVLSRQDIVSQLIGHVTIIEYIAVFSIGAIVVIPLISVIRQLVLPKEALKPRTELIFTIATIGAAIIACGASFSTLPRAAAHIRATKPQSEYVQTLVSANGDVSILCVDLFGSCKETMRVQYYRCGDTPYPFIDADTRPVWQSREWEWQSTPIPAVISSSDLCKTLKKLNDEALRRGDGIVFENNGVLDHFSIDTLTSDLSGQPDVLLGYLVAHPYQITSQYSQGVIDGGRANGN